jgi:hypothetical protein
MVVVNMGAFGPLDVFDDLSQRSSAGVQMRDANEGGEAGRNRQASRNQEAPARRWWFSFDGWLSTDLDSEYVLA